VPPETSDFDGASGAESSAPEAGPNDAGSPLIQSRPYAATVPTKYDAKAATPLVVLLHGYTANAKAQDSYFRMSELAEAKTFLLALPDGTKDQQGNQFWNATDACCNFFAANVDDVAYLRAVIADMKARYNVDQKRVYVVGHSNGGFMAHRLACEMADEIAAIVSLAGAGYADASKCKPQEAVSVLQVHGDADQTVAYAGGVFAPGAPAYPGAKATVAAWAVSNGCGAELAPTNKKLDLDKTLAGEETKIEQHACTTGAAELWTILGGSHVPNFQSSWAELLYGFLEAHPKH
jgi:polyhydroxybutyrate depolymerase